MKDYEIVYIFNPNVDEDNVSQKVESLQSLLLADGGESLAIDHWGLKQFAYPIGDWENGYYVVSHMRVQSSALPEFERVLGLEEDVLRYLIVVNQGEPTTQESVLAEVFNPADPPVTDDDSSKTEEEPTEVVKDSVGPRGSARRRQLDGPPVSILNYKDVDRLSQFITEQGKILPKRTTKVSASFQRQLSKAIKRARFLALVPYVGSHES